MAATTDLQLSTDAQLSLETLIVKGAPVHLLALSHDGVCVTTGWLDVGEVRRVAEWLNEVASVWSEFPRVER